MTADPTSVLTTDLTLAVEAGAGSPIDLMGLALVLVAAWTAGWLANHFGYPAVLGELVAGIVLGPPLLGLLDNGEGLAVVGELGIVLMMLYIGTEIEVEHLRRASGAGLLAAVGGFLVPFAGGVATMLLFGFDGTAAVFVGAAMGVTSLATKSRILADLRLFGTRIAYVLVAGALVSDTATLVLFAGLLSLQDGTGGAATETLAVTLRAAAFFGIMLVAGGVIPRLGRLARDRFGLDGPGWGLGVILVCGLAGAAVAEELGLHGILGSFVAGMIVRRGVLSPRTTRHSVELLGRLSIGVLAPVFFVTAGFAISLPAARDNAALLVTVVVVATLGKVLGTALFYLPSGNGWREGLVVGGAMNGRGAVEIIVAGIALEQGLITTEVFTVLVLMAILTTAMVPVLLKVGVEWLRGRNELVTADGSRRSVTIIGAGAVARAWGLALSEHRDVWLLDTNAHRCALAREVGLQAVVGDAFDREALRRAHVDEAGMVLALTPNVEVNILAAELARDEFGVMEVCVAQGPGNQEGTRVLIERMGASPVTDGPVDLERWAGWLDDGDAAVRTFAIEDVDTASGLAEWIASSEGSVLPLAVVRGDDAIPYTLADPPRVGERVTMVVPLREGWDPGAVPGVRAEGTATHFES